MSIQKRVLIITAVFLILINGYLFFHHSQRTHFECKGSFVMQKTSDRVNADFYLLLDGDKGKFVIDGTMSPDTGETINIRRMALVDFTLHGNSLFTTTYATSRLSDDTDSDNLFHTFIPGFIFYQGAKSLFTLEALPSGSVLISNNQSLQLYCEKTPTN